MERDILKNYFPGSAGDLLGGRIRARTWDPPSGRGRRRKKRAALKGIADKMIVPGLDWFTTAVVILGGGCDEFDEVEWVIREEP